MLINKYNYSTFFYIFIIFHLIIWVAIPSLTNSNLPLDTIEALAWGNDFEWGNNKHPPLSVLSVEIFFFIFSKNDFAYYLLSQIFILINFIFIFEIGKIFFKDNLSRIFIIFLTSLIFYYSYNSTEFNVNICVLPFWSGTILYSLRSLKYNKNLDWIMLGLIAGLGLLSKYIIFYLFVGILIYLLFTFIQNKKINYKIFISFFIFLIVISPHLIWLFNNEFSTLTYASGRATAYKNYAYPFIFLFKQLLLIFFIFMLHFLFFKINSKKIKKFNEEEVFLICVFLIPIILMFFTSLVTGSKVRTAWMMPFYSVSSIFLTYYFFEIKEKSFMYIFIFFYFLSPALYLGSFYSEYTKNRTKDGREKRVLYNGKEISNIVQSQWDSKINKEIKYVIGDEWYGGNLSYHLKDRPLLYLNKGEKHWYSGKNIQSLNEVLMYGVVIIEKDLHQINESFKNFDDDQMLYLRDKNNNVLNFVCKIDKIRLEKEKLNLYFVLPGCK